jgi:hypothetical protein
MRTLTLLAITAIVLSSCQKEASSSGTSNNNNNNKPDTTALGGFIKATGITDEQLKVNLDSLITRARNHGWWDLCKVIYPFAGGTQTSCKFNLKDPRDTDAAFRLTFLGDTWTYTNIEANPGVSGYGNTHFNPAVGLSDPNSCHLSVYSMSDSAGGRDNADIGAYDVVNNLGFYLSTRTGWPDSSGKPFAAISDNAFQGTEVNGAGYFLVTKSGTSASFYQHSPETQSYPASLGNLPNSNLYLCNQNFPLGGDPYNNGFSQRALSFATIGSGIDSATVVSMYSDILNFVSRK